MNTIIRYVRHLIGRQLRSRGWIRVSEVPVADTRSAITLQEGLRRLQRLGCQPRQIIDVGAHTGDWTRCALGIYPNCQYTLFEPQIDLADRMKDILGLSNVTLCQKGVGAESGQYAFAIHTRADSRSFNYTKEEADARGFGRIELPVVALDDYCSENQIQPDVLKIDAEGWDLEIIRGAARTLNGVHAIFIEAGVANSKFPNSVTRVLEEMDQRGFNLFDITDVLRTPNGGFMWNLELLFIKREGYLGQALKGTGISSLPQTGVVE